MGDRGLSKRQPKANALEIATSGFVHDSARSQNYGGGYRNGPTRIKAKGRRLRRRLAGPVGCHFVPPSSELSGTIVYHRVKPSAQSALNSKICTRWHVMLPVSLGIKRT